MHKVHDKARIIAIATFSEKIGGEGAACGAIGFLAYNAKMLVGIGNLLLGEHGADLVGVVAGALENLKLAVLIVCQRESLRRAHADFVFLEGFENGRVQRRQLQHAADIGGGDAERCCNIVNVFAAVDDRPIGGDGIGGVHGLGHVSTVL